MALVGRRDTKPKRFTVPTFSRITDEQNVRLLSFMRTTGKSGSEAIRDLVEAGLNQVEGVSTPNPHEDMQVSLEMLQSLKTEVLTFMNALLNGKLNVLEVSAQAEGVAQADLQSFRQRRRSRGSLRRALEKEVASGK